MLLPYPLSHLCLVLFTYCIFSSVSGVRLLQVRGQFSLLLTLYSPRILKILIMILFLSFNLL